MMSSDSEENAWDDGNDAMVTEDREDQGGDDPTPTPPEEQENDEEEEGTKDDTRKSISVNNSVGFHNERD